ncbi:MAG: type I DNA topoisomerase [Muribaculaceae bacterium]|nr:type I DNA topoisomerase [Muribaculaceae bacterium]MDE7457873.1 type I DNA topoisomerase [Muribaculaceae bacterium]
MLKNLVIVESPAKAKTIEKFLGKDYKVMSSYGHIRDLRKKNFSIDIDNGFQPIYEIPEDKKQLVSELKKAASQAETVWLASDEDREGEAIAWHLYEVLGLKPENTRRIVFHEITKNAILHAIANPRSIDINRVDAQQARRVLDRIVGFELSPVLWKKIKPALSAGRVQSVAVRLIVERENEIKNFVSEPYFRVNAHFAIDETHAIKSELNHRLPDIDSAKAFLQDCAKATFTVSDINVRPIKKSPAPPFTTSTLQQEASRKLGFTVSQTMMVAQRLYEAGHITYMRTDSVNLSNEAIASISDEIKRNIGEEYLHVRRYHTNSKGAQEAHEAIRPTYISNATIEGTAQEKRLYALIWKRTIASQMADAQVEKTTIDIQPSTRQEHFVANGETIQFDGFLRVYIESRDDEEAEEGLLTLPKVSVGEELLPDEITAIERFTQQPPRYTEASLVKKMEELGIGRPSTYAPTISTIQQREYVEKGEKEGVKRSFDTLTLKKGKITDRKKTETVGSEKGKLIPTDIGEVVNTFLTEYFPDILDYNFTARVEEKFDEIAEGKLPWANEMSDFYQVFHPEVDKALSIKLEHKVGERVLGTDPSTGEQVSVKIGRFGPLVQIGTGEGEEKPRFASLLKGQSVSTITLDEALRLFEFPRTIGEYEGDEVVVAIGRFGPYVRHQGKFVSIPKDIAPAALSLEEAIDLINAKREAEEKKVVKVFDQDEDLRILNGRYGIYISYKKDNFKIPRTVSDPASLTYDEAMEIVNSQETKPKKTRASRKKA